MIYIEDGTAEIVLHPTRYLILRFLQDSVKPMYVDEIAKVVKVHPRMVSHHVDILEEKGLIISEYGLINSRNSKRKVAVRLCSVTQKLYEVFEDIRKSTSLRK